MIRNYRQHEDHMQFSCTALEYPPLLQAWYYRDISGDGYQAVSPRYLISRCPFCGAEHAAKVDTHSIISWNMPVVGAGKCFGQAQAEEINCQHFVCVQKFVNLEGVVPVECDALEVALHRPFVMPFFLPNEPPSAAVIHSLPLFRIEDHNGEIYNYNRATFVKPIHEIKPNLERQWSGSEYTPFENITPEDQERLATARFVRRYTAFAVTYYSREPKWLLGQYADGQITANTIADPTFTAADVRAMAGMHEISPEGYNLQQWVAGGKLHWLDLELPDLPLKSGGIDQFPYHPIFDLTGSLEPFTYHKGLFTWGGMWKTYGRE